jgi:prepilin-type N-terminal cleavage/methylation domain-containing protein
MAVLTGSLPSNDYGPMGRRLRWLQHDEGFTLVELIIGMLIVGLLVSAIGSALVVSLRTTAVTTARFKESHDAQITSAYLANDVQSAATVAVPGGSNCTSSTLLADFNYTGGLTASYFCGPSAGETRVTRTYNSKTVVVAHFAGTGRPTVTCSPACSGAPSSPDSVTIGFTEASGFSYTLIGSRRSFSSDGGGGGGQSTPPLTLLATASGGNSPLWIAGGCPPGQEALGNCQGDSSGSNPNDSPSLIVRGNLYVNTAISNAVKITGLKRNGELTINNGGNFKILDPGGCAGCNPNTVTCAACTWNGNQAWTNYSPALPDPLANMSNPTSSTTGSCASRTCQPGVYNSTLTINGGGTWTLQPGIYILNGGISVTGNSAVQGSGVMLFVQGSTSSINFAGGAAINLTPPTSGTYKNVLIFQSRSDTSAATFNGGASATLLFGGIIYAPASSQVTLSSGGAALNVTAVIAQNIKLSGNAQVTVG